jgi:hypothetical protein
VATGRQRTGSLVFGGGGIGAQVTTVLAVTPGQRLYAEVGVGGGIGTFRGNGGGASDIRTCSMSDSCPALGSGSDPRLVVAGGGGGLGFGGGGGEGGGAGVFPQTQPQSTISAPQTLTITNQGGASMSLTGLTFAGTDPGDFLLTSNG